MKFEVAKWGPQKLREILESIQKAINDRTLIASETIQVEQLPEGVRPSVVTADSGGTGEGESASGGSGGTNVNIYGALNGQPALFHLVQTSPATPV